MKKTFFASIVTVLLSTACGAMAAEVSVTSDARPQATSPVRPTVQKYAQVCLGNLSNRTVLVGTSWVGEARNLAWIQPGEKHIYRFETTGTIPATGLDDSVQKLNVAFRPRGLFTQFDVTELWLPFSYVETDNCDAMPQYNFVFVSQLNGATKMVLSPVYYAVPVSNE